VTATTMSALPHGGGGSLGTTRNRTDVFLKYRNQARGVRPAASDADNGKESSRCGSLADLRMLQACSTTTTVDYTLL